MRLSLIAISLIFLLSACVPGSFASHENLSPTPVFIMTTTTRTPATMTGQTIPEAGTATPFPPATRTAVPTFTPATPAEDANLSYKLREWTPDQADLLIGQISSQLSVIEGDPIYSSVYGYSAYMDMYRYLVFAETEAL